MSMWNFDTNDLEKIKSPLDIVRKQCDELSDISGGKIIARVAEYDGKYRSSAITLSLKSNIGTVYKNDLLSSILYDPEETFDVQNVMGDKAVSDDNYNNKFVYELFITSKKTPKYKYRVLLMYYSIDMYPVGLTIQKDIAKEIEFASEGIQFNDEESFVNGLAKILGSSTLGSILKKLMILNLQ